MCFGDGGASRRAADAAQAESQRQFNIEQQRLKDEAAAAKAEAERRAAEEAVRYQAQFDQQKADAEAQRKQD
jgi:colicin import membrane protein